MQTLTAGSFLNLENDSIIESLKHTARRLAEHTATVVKENLPPAALENLANTLWGKAEYVTRETERRRLHQIFVENFNERFRELKPATAQAEDSSLEFSTANAPIENAGSKEKSNAPEIIESVNGESTEAAARENFSSTISSEESAPEVPEVEEKTDEFLGFVDSGETFKDVQAKDTSVATTVPEETAPTIVQNADELNTETSEPENQLIEVETPISTDQSFAEKVESPTVDTSNQAKPEATNAAVPESKPITTTSAAKAGANVSNGRDPFEFEKCTINLNLTLLPMESGSSKRKVIVGAMSHNLPPEIEFIEVADGADLTQIATLVSDKLARFKQTLPVKYIEQLRASKAKSAKKTAPAKTTAATAAPTKPAVDQPKVEKTSSEQKVSETKRDETVKPPSEKATEKGGATISQATVPAANQSFGANNIQGSLF